MQAEAQAKYVNTIKPYFYAPKLECLTLAYLNS